jgi:hypothetical protein
METIEVRNTAQSAEEMAGASKSRKSQSLRLDKQIIRTLTGAELQLVSGGRGCTCCTCTCHSSQE